jgi:hypothetical protein
MHPLAQGFRTSDPNIENEPRIVAHGGTISLVTTNGELWQVFDSEGPNGELRDYPLSDDRVYARIFVRMDREAEPRIHRFRDGESRSTSPIEIAGQLERAEP